MYNNREYNEVDLRRYINMEPGTFFHGMEEDEVYKHLSKEALIKVILQMIKEVTLHVAMFATPREDSILYNLKDLLQSNHAYWRECSKCGYANNTYAHCMHSKTESYCIRCKTKLPRYEIDEKLTGICNCDFVIRKRHIETIIETI